MSQEEKKVTFNELVEAWDLMVEHRADGQLSKAHESVYFKYLCQNLGLESELLDLKIRLDNN